MVNVFQLFPGRNMERYIPTRRLKDRRLKTCSDFCSPSTAGSFSSWQGCTRSLGCGNFLGSSLLWSPRLFLPLPLFFKKRLRSSDLLKVNKCWTSVESMWSLWSVCSPWVQYPVSFKKYHPLLVWGDAHEWGNLTPAWLTIKEGLVNWVIRGFPALCGWGALFPQQKQVVSQGVYSLKVRLLYYETSSRCDKQWIADLLLFFFFHPRKCVCMKSAESCLSVIYDPLLTTSYQVPTSPFLMQFMSEWQ